MAKRRRRQPKIARTENPSCVIHQTAKRERLSSSECPPGDAAGERFRAGEELVASREAGWVAGVADAAESSGEEERREVEGQRRTAFASWLAASPSKCRAINSGKICLPLNWSGTFRSRSSELPPRKFSEVRAQRLEEKAGRGDRDEREPDAAAWCKFFSPRKSVDVRRPAREDAPCFFF